LVSLLLAATIVLDGARLVLPLLDARASVPASAARVSPPYRPRSVNAQSIVEHHLFGVAIDDSSDTSAPSRAPANLILQGTFAMKDAHRGMAIVAADGSAQVYKVGDGIAGATLESVYSDRVALRRGGRLETLALPRLPVPGGEAPNSPPRIATDEGVGPTRAAPKSIGDLMRADPAMEEDSEAIQGFRLHPGRSNAAFIRAGLRAGDIMTAVNGTPLAGQDPQRSQEFVNSALTGDHATVSVLRNGKPLEVSVDLAR
jgi:general secretion pathway protein C